MLGFNKTLSQSDCHVQQVLAAHGFDYDLAVRWRVGVNLRCCESSKLNLGLECE